jgi:hypothetical protein
LHFVKLFPDGHRLRCSILVSLSVAVDLIRKSRESGRSLGRTFIENP